MIHYLKTQMELTYNSIYNFQEALLSDDNEQIAVHSEILRNKARELYISLLQTSGSYSKNSANKLISIELLFDFVCECSGIEKEQLLETSKKRKRELVLARQVHMTFLNVTFGLSLSSAGNYYNKDHATVIHACKTIQSLFQTNKHFRHQYSRAIDHCINYDTGLKRTTTFDFLNEN